MKRILVFIKRAGLTMAEEIILVVILQKMEF
jgi:hypothetical protein